MTNGIVNMMYVLQRLGVTVLLAAVLSAASLSPLQAQEASINCDSGGQGLQKKIDSAAHGAEIFISGSCADGPFIVSKDLKLIGSGTPTLSAPSGGNVLFIRRASVEVRNLNIDGGGINGGISIEGSSVVINRVLVERTVDIGIRVHLNSSGIITNSEIRDSSFAGIVVQEASGALLIGNTIVNNGTGIFLNGSSSADTRDNVIDGNDFGIVVDQNSTLFLRGSTIINSTNDGLLVRTHGIVQTVDPPNTFGGNLGVDVSCVQRGILAFETGPQLPSTGSATTDGSCLVFGTIF